MKKHAVLLLLTLAASAGAGLIVNPAVNPAAAPVAPIPANVAAFAVDPRTVSENDSEHLVAAFKKIFE